MDSWYIGTVTLFAFNWAPQSYAECNGATMNISQNQALFALISNKFGGNGTTNFNLPDLRGRVPVGQGQGPLINWPFAQKFGADTAKLTANNLPLHPISEVQAGKTVSATAAATVNALAGQANKLPPTNNYWGRGFTGTAATQNYADSHDTTMATDAVQVTVTPTFNVTNLLGGTNNVQAFNLNPPSLALIYCICTQGLYPSRP